MGVTQYQLLERIGVGGMAEVFRARPVLPNGEPGEPVVIKRILPHLSADPEFRAMFVDEAKIAAVLQHPNVVKLLDLGRLDEQLFLAFELVEGADVEKLLRRADACSHPIQLPIALFVVRQLLKGLDHAHTRRAPDGEEIHVVHRDVSPANVLVSRDGDVKLADFGVAKATFRGGRTIAGVIKGNTHYMSPEQLSGHDVDARTDIYAAGMVLLTLILGRHPWSQESMASLLHKIISGTLPKPSDLAPVDAELDAIVARATAKSREERFPDAKSFLAALDDYAAATRMQATARDLALLVAELLPEQEAPTVRTRLEDSIVRRLEPLFEGVDGEATPTQIGLLEEEIESRGVPPPDWRGVIPGGDRDAIPTRPGEPTAFTRTLSTTDELETQPGDPPTPDEPATFFDDPESLEPTSPGLEEDPAAPVGAIPPRARPAGSPDAIGHTPFPRGPAELTPVDTPIVVAGTAQPGTAHAPSAPRETPDAVLRGHRGAVSALAFVRGGAFAVSASHDGTLRVWEIGSREERACLRGHRGAVTSLSLSGDGAYALSGGRDRTLRLWDLANAREVRCFEGHTNWVFATALDPRMLFAVSGGLDRALRIWDLSRPEAARVVPAHEDAIAAVALLPGARALTGGYDRALRVWDLATGTETARLLCDRSVRALTVTRDGRRAVSAGADSLLTVWDVVRNNLVHRLDGHLEPVVALACTPDGRHVLSGSYDGTARMWDIGLGARREMFGVGGGEPVMSIACSPDGAFFLAGRADGTIELWGLRGLAR